MTYNQLRDIIIERTTELTKCKYQNDINQKKLLEAQARIKELQECIEQRNRMINDLWKEKEMYVIKYNECRKAALLEAAEWFDTLQGEEPQE